jgi:outer membrane protein OmpA-like peptidoglycan-associated protein
MKLTSKVFTLLAFALISGTAFAVRAEEQPGYPVQVEIEARTIHTTHSLRNLHGMMAQETIAPAMLFATASDKLTGADKIAVKKVAALLKSPAYSGHHVLISGYTDNKGKDASNQRLSYHRAVTVVKALEKLGVPASQLTAQGFGKENPAASNATAEGRALNRRVTFTLND